ncbi:hypothetical protein D3C87_1748120 [compost metagenome]
MRHGAFQQRQEGAAGLGRIGGQAQQGAEEGIHDLRGLQGLAFGLRLKLIQQPHALAIQHFQAPLEHRLNE